ncbi:MAG: P1 family peptidase [Dethiosulfatibacter sp.]|nr:P1 family peptidase [Dethiosulfatibacter sp.]
MQEGRQLNNQKRISDFGIEIGKLPKGKLNKITDVSGVSVGHFTIDTEDHKTGVTVIIPSPNNIFENKLVAASHVLNGYGKTVGLLQIDELGTLESPIFLTNTLNVGIVQDAAIEHMIQQCSLDGITLESINTVVGECNDSYLNKIQDRVVQKQHVMAAIDNSSQNFEEGSVGAGRGVSCYQLKGGIGSSSRVVKFDSREYHIGVLVQSNHGLLKDLIINGKEIGKEIDKIHKAERVEEKGSIIIVLATDLPLESRQLKRICKRVCVGLSRSGSFIGNGSGEVVIGFSTGNSIAMNSDQDFHNVTIINENKINVLFRAAAEATEEAVLNSMVTSEKTVGYKGNVRESLATYIKDVMGLCDR